MRYIGASPRWCSGKARMAVRQLKAYAPVGAHRPRHLKAAADSATPDPAETETEHCIDSPALVITTPPFELSSVAVTAGDVAEAYPQAG